MIKYTFRFNILKSLTLLAFALIQHGILSVAVAEDVDECIARVVADSKPEMTLGEVRQECTTDVKSPGKLGSLSRRILNERSSSWNRHIIAAHEQNYIMPYYYSDNLNREAYSTGNDWEENLGAEEIKFQISLKVPLTHEKLFRDHDALYFGISIESWWQLYADEVSAPFRETNYRPELFYLTPITFHPFSGNTGLQIGLVHESNGRSQLLSRSWNRIYTAFIFEKDNMVLTFRPWYRIPEDEKETPLSSKGDDNPDIDEYLGYFDLAGAYKFGESELTFMFRNNLSSDNKGAIELGYSFPLSGNLKGFVQYFNGYGESLIDYNHEQQRIGLGILLTDWL